MVLVSCRGVVGRLGGRSSHNTFPLLFLNSQMPTPPFRFRLRITALNVRRKELVKEQQGALAQRKTLSAEIGKLMREKKVGRGRGMRNACVSWPWVGRWMELVGELVFIVRSCV